MQTQNGLHYFMNQVKGAISQGPDGQAGHKWSGQGCGHLARCPGRQGRQDTPSPPDTHHWLGIRVRHSTRCDWIRRPWLLAPTTTPWQSDPDMVTGEMREGWPATDWTEPRDRERKMSNSYFISTGLFGGDRMFLFGVAEMPTRSKTWNIEAITIYLVYLLRTSHI